MTAQNPPDFLQAGTYTAELMRLLPSALVAGRGGVVLAGDLAVTQNGTPNMSVNVAGGKVIIPGTEATYQGVYVAENRGTTNLAISAANATNPRYDIVVAKVQDASYSGATNLWSLAVVTGTAAASPVEPTLPANAIQLARVTVGAAVTTITTANILDRRTTTTRGLATGLGGTVVTTSALLPNTNLHEGMYAHATDVDRLLGYNGTAWVGAVAFGQPAPQFYNAALFGGAATTNTVYGSVPVALTAPYPLTMVVEVSGRAGGTGVAHLTAFKVLDEAGNTITQGDFGGTQEMILSLDGDWTPFHLVGRKDYAAGATCGFQLTYRNDTSSLNIQGPVKVTFYPKVS